MEAIKEIEWTGRALRNYDIILDYLSKHWKPEVSEEFELEFIRTLNRIAKFPEIGVSLDKRKAIRGFLITPHNKIIYRIKGSKIIMISIFDTRQHPSKMKL